MIRVTFGELLDLCEVGYLKTLESSRWLECGGVQLQVVDMVLVRIDANQFGVAVSQLADRDCAKVARCVAEIAADSQVVRVRLEGVNLVGKRIDAEDSVLPAAVVPATTWDNWPRTMSPS